MFPHTNPGFQFPLVVLDGSTIAAGIAGVVDGDNQMLCHQVVDRRVIQLSGVFPLDEQRQPELVEVPGQMTVDFISAGLMDTGHGQELIAGMKPLR